MAGQGALCNAPLHPPPFTRYLCRVATLAASTRMYNVAPAATAAWHRLLGAVSRRAHVALDITDHPHPATLNDLWSRPDLGCAFMCGWPLAQDPAARPVIAAPIPAGESGPAYHAVFVVPAASPHRRLADTFGGRFAFNARGSHSGWNMPWAHLRPLGATFASLVGPFGPHQNAAAAVAAGEADVAAIDSLVWALLRRHAPADAARLRPVARTPPQPSPPLVGSAALPPAEAARLRTALLALADDAPGRALLADVCLAGFAPATRADYAVTRTLEPPA